MADYANGNVQDGGDNTGRPPSPKEPYRERSRSPRDRSRSPKRRRRDDDRDNDSRPVRGKRIFVSNIPYEMKWTDIKDMFKREVGSDAYVELYDGPDGKPTGTGVLEYRRIEDAQKCVDVMHRRDCKGRNLVCREERESDRRRSDRLKQNSQRGGGGMGDNAGPMSNDMYSSSGNNINPQILQQLGIEGPPTNTVFVANLDYKVNWKKLKDIFRMAGNVQRAEIKEDKDGKSRGIGIVTFDHPMEAVQAISMFHGQILYERAMTVRMDRHQQQDQGPLTQNMRLPAGLKTIGAGLGMGGAPVQNIAQVANNMGGGGMMDGMGGGPMGGPDMGSMGDMQMQNMSAGNMNPSLGGGGGLGGAGLQNLGGGNLGGLGNLGGQLGNLSSLGGAPANSLGGMGLAGGNPGISSLLGGTGGGLSGLGGNMGANDGYGSTAMNMGNLGGMGGMDSTGFGGGGGGLHGDGGRDLSRYDRGSGGGGGRDNRFDDRGSRGRYDDRGGSGRGGGPRDENCTVFVRNLPFSFTWQTLKEHFRAAGDVKFSEIKMDGNRSKGYGTVRFGTSEDAHRAINLLNGSNVEGRKIEVRMDSQGR